MKKIVSMILIFAIICSLTVIVNAESLTLKLSADKNEIKVGDTVTITVDWGKPMSSADFTLKYNSAKLEYQSSSIPEGMALASKENSAVKVVWTDIAGKQLLTKATFTFKAITEGESLSQVEVEQFSDADVVAADSYDTKSKVTIKIKATGSDIKNETVKNETVKNETVKNETVKNETVTPINPVNKTTTGGNKAVANNSAKPTKIPHAGKENMGIVIALAVVAVMGFGYKVNKYKDI